MVNVFLSDYSYAALLKKARTMIKSNRLCTEEGFKYINRRYATALLITASLLLVSQIIIQLTIINMKSDARVVNISGRQRMLSQKITKCSFGLLLSDTAEQSVDFATELNAARNLWKESHEALRYGSEAMRLPGDNSQAVEALYEKMEPHYQAILQAVSAILNLTGQAGPREPANKDGQSPGGQTDAELETLRWNALTIRANETEFLGYMDRIVFQYDAESNTKLLHLQILEFSILLIALCVLVLEWRVVFKPAQKEIEIGFDIMKKNEDYLNQLFETTPAMTILFDATTLKAVKYNAMAVQLIRAWLGVELSDETAFAAVLPGPAEDPALSERLLAKLKAEKELSNLEVCITEEQVVLLSAKTLNTGDKTLYLIGLSDITTLKQMATFDSMTAMLNRRTGLELLEYLCEESARNQTGLTICFIDIDRLKFVNDTHGHQEGDHYIKTVAKTITSRAGETYKGIRYGGDELILVTESASLDRFRALMRQVNDDLYVTGHMSFKSYTMSVSYGIVSYNPAVHRTISDLIEEADLSMYEHKKSKRAQRVDGEK